MKKYKKLICLDFDGVIHSYASGWKGARNIPDLPVKGAIGWIDQFIMNHCDSPEEFGCMNSGGDYELAIFSSRSRYWGGRKAMKRWLIKHGLHRLIVEKIKFPLWKPAATLLIDDRAITFKGEFPSFEEISTFKPWNKTCFRV